VAVALKLMPTPVGQENPFLLMNGAVVLAAWYGGRGPALLALTLAVVAVDYLFLPPAGLVLTAAKAVKLGFFVVEAAVTAAITIAMKEAQCRAEMLTVQSKRDEEQLRKLDKAHRACSGRSTSPRGTALPSWRS
jgi:K+-sensing histidine kinase KdpD